MAIIGTFKKTGTEYTGEIVTLSVQAKNVKIAPEPVGTGDNTPSHRIYVGRAEVGAGWTRKSNEGRTYLLVRVDDPSFVAPLYANLIDDDDGKTASLIWSRPVRKAD